MPKLTREQKIFIVERLACFATPTEVAKEAFDELGLTIDRGQVFNYDGSKAWLRERISADLLKIFDTTRIRFLTEISDIAIANKSYRLRELDTLYRKAKGKDAVSLAAAMLEQAAKEAGDAYTNRQKVEHSGEIRTHDALSDDERAARLTALLDAARARRVGSTADGPEET